MTMTDRLQWLAVGMMIGFVLGYVVRALREIRGERKLSREEREKIWSNRGEDGFMRFPVVHDVAIIFALALTVWAAFAAAHVNGQIKHVTECNQQFLQTTLQTEEQRTVYLKSQVDANTSLQKAQSSFLRTVYSNNSTDQDRITAGHVYLDSLDHFVKIGKGVDKLDPYPTVDALRSCYND